MASTVAAMRNLGVHNGRMAVWFAGVGLGRAGTNSGIDIATGGSRRRFMQAAIKCGRAGNNTMGLSTRLTAQQRLGKDFFNFRSTATPASCVQQIRSRLFHTFRARRSTTLSPNPTPHLNSPKNENLSLSQRMRKLSREYGWVALGVYLALSALDFPFCYLLVRYLGTDKIGEWEHIIVSNVKAIIPESVKTTWHEWRASVRQAEKDLTGDDRVNDGVDMAGWGVEEAEQRNKKDASLATQLALAYAIHKSFIFLRVPLAAAVTPKVVKVLRGWGWDIGKRTTKATKAANAAEVAAQKAEKAARKAQK